MGTLRYSMLVSLDGYVAREDGSLDWHVVTPEWHRFVNETCREADVLLYGRRTWDVMYPYWPYPADDPSAPDYAADFSRIWLSKPKAVVSKTLGDAGWGTEILRTADAVRELKERTGGIILLGGPDLAATLIERDLVDEFGLYLQPVAIGHGKRFWPDGRRLDLELVETRTFDAGVVYVRYRRASASNA